MDIPQLRYFQAIANAGSLSRAAISLGVTQPALSRQIRLLERELNVKLLRRTGRGVVLTALGATFAERIRVVLDGLDDARDAMLSESARPSGEITLGTVPSLGIALAAQAITQFSARHPGVSVRLMEGQPTEVWDWLHGGVVDLCLMRDPPALTAKVAGRDLFEDEVFLIGAPSQKRREKPYSIEELADLPLILPSARNSLRLQIERAAAAASRTLRIACEVDSLSVQKELIRKGIGYGLLALSSVYADVENGTLVPSRIEPPIRRNVACLWLARTPLTGAPRAFFECLVAEADRIAAGDFAPAATRSLPLVPAV